MASSSRGKYSGKTTAIASNSKQKDDDGLYFTSKTPHFFKVLQRDAIEHGKMKIPALFVRKYGSGISSPVYLKVPSGAMWQVELTESNAGICLQNGWREFGEHHTIKFGDLVVFKYEGNCLFNVVIFDKGASEIEYPIFSNQAENLSVNGQSQGPANEEEDDDTSVEILDDMPMASSKKSLCKYPNVKVPMRPCYLLHGVLCLPVAFGRRYLMAVTGTKMVILQVSERSWPVKLISYRSKCCLTGGWPVFAKENSLRADDICVFELIKGCCPESIHPKKGGLNSATTLHSISLVTLLSD